MRITAKGITETNKHLQEMVARVKSLKPAMEAGALDIKKLVDDAFYKSIDPNTGTAWQPLAESTIKKRRQGSSKPLIDTGRLRGSIATKAGDKSITYGTNVVYGGPHQFGTKKIPQRRFLPTDFSTGPASATAQKIVRRILNYITKGVAK